MRRARRRSPPRRNYWRRDGEEGALVVVIVDEVDVSFDATSAPPARPSLRHHRATITRGLVLRWRPVHEQRRPDAAITAQQQQCGYWRAPPGPVKCGRDAHHVATHRCRMGNDSGGGEDPTGRREAPHAAR
jgi:hypothetical protein